MIAIGRELRRSGLDVVISIAQPYAHLAEAADLRVEIAFTKERFEAALADPNFWKPVRGAWKVARLLAGEFLQPHFDLIRRSHRPGETILVAHPLDLSSRIFRDLEQATPLVSVHLAPTMLRIPDSPPKVTPWWWEPRRPPGVVKTAYWLADRLALDPAIAGLVNRLRGEHGLPPVSRIFHQWWLSPDRIIAMYPRWFAPETEIFSPRLIHAGFPLEDLSDRESEAATLGRPFVFTAGTANHHCREFFRHAAEVCRKLDHPGILLSTFDENFPPQLPTQVQCRHYISLRSLLPDCAAIVHHGGIGTTSQAFAAATPQLVRPMAFDQFDNATRVETLGCGLWLRRDRDLSHVLRQCFARPVRSSLPSRGRENRSRPGRQDRSRRDPETAKGLLTKPQIDRQTRTRVNHWVSELKSECRLHTLDGGVLIF